MDFVLAAAFELVVVKTGALLVRAVSLGRWRAEPPDAIEHQAHAPAGALSYRRQGQTVVTVTGQTVAGTLFWVLAAGCAVAVLVHRA